MVYTGLFTLLVTILGFQVVSGFPHIHWQRQNQDPSNDGQDPSVPGSGLTFDQPNEIDPQSQTANVATRCDPTVDVYACDNRLFMRCGQKSGRWIPKETCKGLCLEDNKIRPQCYCNQGGNGVDCPPPPTSTQDFFTRSWDIFGTRASYETVTATTTTTEEAPTTSEEATTTATDWGWDDEFPAPTFGLGDDGQGPTVTRVLNTEAVPEATETGGAGVQIGLAGAKCPRINDVFCDSSVLLVCSKLNVWTTVGYCDCSLEIWAGACP
ncbi:uncharacterized protein EV422DRAFT_617838 [Fimicolochytrium jonesii]|uniref:uncharacterized protein n=1 Tax=Fimicolochytrium jonesii TaxID=1396493 RepID=UPI0022FE9FDF|nr:uncharacterized protein EV422DRAFT_617838 [Fimicolochytrium jonesii]KAI8824116.1 hypothetical protein EV422DRAFT_617838 [Fimicolochytrium jonesii]